MGLVESSQGRSFPWGPAKSRSAHQFSGGGGGRSYDGKPRQAATLPGRTRVCETALGPTSRGRGFEDHFVPPVNDSDCQPIQPARLNGSIHEAANPDKGNAINKRRSDPLIGYFNRIAHNGTVTLANGMDESLSKWFLSRSDESLCPSEEITFAADSSRTPYFRTSVSFPCSADNDTADVVTCEEKHTQTSPISTLDKTSASRCEPACAPQSRSGRNINRGRLSNKISTSVPANPRSEPYTFDLYYDEPSTRQPTRHEDSDTVESLNNSLSRASLYINGDKSVAVPKSKKSQVFIECYPSGVLGDVGDRGNVQVVQMSPNVWFESNVAEGRRKLPQRLLRKQASDSNLAKVAQRADGRLNTHITLLPSVFVGRNDTGCPTPPTRQMDDCSDTDRLQPIDTPNVPPQLPCDNVPPNPSVSKSVSESPFGKTCRVPSPISGDSSLPRSVPIAPLEHVDHHVDIESSDRSLLASSVPLDKLQDAHNLHVVSRVVEGGTFPVLRLPRLEGQANLVDILTSGANLRDNGGPKTTPYDGRWHASLPSSFKSRSKSSEAGVILPPRNNRTTNALDKDRGDVSDISLVDGDAIAKVSAEEGSSIRRKTCRQVDLSDNGACSSYEMFSSQANESTRNISVNGSQELPKLRKMHSSDEDCGFTCHEQCQDVVSLDCKMALTDITTDDLETSDNEAEPELCVTPTKPAEDTDEEIEAEEKHEEEIQEKDLGYCELAENEQISTLRRTVCRIQSQMVASSEIEEWVEKYSSANQGLQIAKENDGSYRGCLRIYLNLSRPINIVAGTRPPSIYDILQEDRTIEKTLTSFYMPRDAVKAIHITSKTTTREVIIALLKKFKVVDNPQKFALYEKTYDVVQSMKAKFHRLDDTECPLVLAIAWGAQSLTNKRLVLQENDTADIQWDAFSLPELYNFLRILDKEEAEYKNQIRDKYGLLRKRINDHLSLGKS